MWLFDACDTPLEKLEECGAQLCKDDLCELPDEDPCLAPEEGRCAGDVVQLCVAGRDTQIDCAKQGLVCAQGDEGAECVPRPQRPCRDAMPRCQGQELLWCERGETRTIDCAAWGAECLTLPGASQPSCVEVRDDEQTLDPACGACGCPGATDPAETRCDGRDDDGDGLVDEELDCGPVPVLALLVASASGEASHAREDIEAELARANELFAQTTVPGRITFMLKELTVLRDDALRELSDDEMQALVRDPRVHRLGVARPHFELPILFTDTLVSGGRTPKVGSSTLPNGTCGGMQESVGPELGLIALAKGRSPTTLAHELGHFLGLCHTHDRPQGTPRVAARTASGALESCDVPCREDGDGICDTPFDPGPESCRYDLACSTQCTQGDEPDAQNLMSYYTACRRRFSDDQVRLMQHSLALRRGFHACEQDKCPCTLGGSDCPVGMSCRLRGDAGPRCTLDGPQPAGSMCESGLACGHNAMCLQESSRGLRRCVRACTASRADCRCVPAGDDLRVCVDDFERLPGRH